MIREDRGYIKQSVLNDIESGKSITEKIKEHNKNTLLADGSISGTVSSVMQCFIRYFDFVQFFATKEYSDSEKTEKCLSHLISEITKDYYTDKVNLFSEDMDIISVKELKDTFEALHKDPVDD